MPYDVPADLASLSLADIAEALAARRLPPVSEWNPPETIDSRMRIAADGTWYHDGSPITRKAMVRAFSSLLMRQEDGSYCLVTPQNRQLIAVEDVPFVAVDMQVRSGGDGEKAGGAEALAFRLNTDEFVLAGPDNPLRAAGDRDTPAIYLHVRHGCEARLDRSTWLQLAGHALETGDGTRVASGSATFSLVPS